ncbi:unnamed protein product [Oikopleura dioica]|uniref:Uncharacterized protein n=1 Tax=Oikopleura dioica TaxID=34765 RepID=E4XLL1_OIKDI|nr:unnamed protein product [Oikopleura dioica]
MTFRALYKAAENWAPKYGIALESDPQNPLGNSERFIQDPALSDYRHGKTIKAKITHIRQEFLLESETDWNELSRFRVIRPTEALDLELVVGDHLPSHAKENIIFDESTPGKAKQALFQRLKWKRIFFQSKNLAKSFWIVKDSANPLETFRTITSFIAESEGENDSQEWEVTLGKNRKIKIFVEPTQARRGDLILGQIESWSALEKELRINEGNKDPLEVKPIYPKDSKLRQLTAARTGIWAKISWVKPWALLEIWKRLDQIESRSSFKEWNNINEVECLGKGFWTHCALETIRRYPVKAKRNFEEGLDDSHWIWDTFEIGMDILNRMLLNLDKNSTPSNMVEHMNTVSRISVKYERVRNTKNGWAVLQAKGNSEWAKNKPTNKNAWMIDFFGNHQTTDSSKAKVTPLARILTAMALEITFKQAKNDFLATRLGESETVGMQWRINFHRLTNERFIQHWVSYRVHSLMRPEETTHIQMIGRGQNTKIIWVPHSSVPHLWIWNQGGPRDVDGDSHSRLLRSAANHLAIKENESQALKDLAEGNWELDEINQCFDRFKTAENYADENLVIVGMNQPSVEALRMIQAVQSILKETKRQKPNSNASLKHAAITLTGGWKWLTGEPFIHNDSADRVLRTWLRNRIKLKNIRENHAEKLQQRDSLKITQKKWEDIFKNISNKESRGISQNPEMEANTPKFEIQGFTTIMDAWKATAIFTHESGKSVAEWVKCLQDTELFVFERYRKEFGHHDGLTLYSFDTEEETCFSAFQVGFKTKHEDSLAQLICRQIRIQDPRSWSNLVEVIATQIKDSTVMLNIVAPRESDAKNLTSRLSDKGVDRVIIVTQPHAILQVPTLKERIDVEIPVSHICWEVNIDEGDGFEARLTPSWAHPKVAARMDKAIRKPISDLTSEEIAVMKGESTWEALVLTEGQSLAPPAKQIFLIREIHLDGIKAGDYLTEQANPDNFFPTQLEVKNQLEASRWRIPDSQAWNEARKQKDSEEAMYSSSEDEKAVSDDGCHSANPVEPSKESCPDNCELCVPAPGQQIEITANGFSLTNWHLENNDSTQ